MSATPALSERPVTDDAYNDVMRRIRSHSLLSAEEEVSLAKRFERGDLVAKEMLVDHNLRLVARTIRLYEGQGLPRGDLLNEGVMGLIRAAEKFDWRKGFRFSTYATPWIHQAMQRALENKGRTIRMPVHKEQRLRKVKKAERELTAQLGFEPSMAELAEYLEWPEEEIESLLRDSRPLASLDKPVGDEQNTLLLEMLPDKVSSSTEDLVEGYQRNLRLYRAVAELPEPTREITVRYFGLGGRKPETLIQIGSSLGVSDKRASQIMHQGLEWLSSNHGSELRFLFEYGGDGEAASTEPTPLDNPEAAQIPERAA